MPFGLDTLSEISLIAMIDGEDCSEEDSVLGHWGLVIWITLAVYLMVGQFVICEEYFVPILAQLGDRWHMPEDVQGATLLAVGSSSPELFTAVLGVIFYPNDNPGPGTNVGSAVFNLCIIVGLSAIFAPRAAKLQIIPFLRDSIAYMIGLVQLYMFYTVISPGMMEIWESILLTAWWALYVITVYRTDLLTERCCCCIPVANATHAEQTHGGDSVDVGANTKALDSSSTASLSRNDHNSRRQLHTINAVDNTAGTSTVTATANTNANTNTNTNVNANANANDKVNININASATTTSRMDILREDEEMGPIADMDQNPDIHLYDNIRIAPGALSEGHIDEDLQRLLAELDRKQRENVNKGWLVVIMPKNQPRGRGHSKHVPIPSSNDVMIDDDHHPPHHHHHHHLHHHQHHHGRNMGRISHSYVRRRTLMETISHERAREAVEHKYDEDHEPESRGGQILHKMLTPWIKLFSWTLPKKEGTFVANHIYISIIMLVSWLGLLTFFVVDCAEKIGNCFNIPGNLLGITLLAVGSSLPDCISSIIVARQMKIDMAVANAFGSNIFDVNLCVGFSFILGSIAAMAQGESSAIFLGDAHALTAFSELILAAAGFMLMLWLMMWCTIFRLEKWIGYVLSVSYVGYICVFTVLFVHAADMASEMGEGSAE